MCTFKGSNEKCRLESECAKQGMCNGATALCPASEPKENFTSCHSETQVCLGGVRWLLFFLPVASGCSMRSVYFNWRPFFLLPACLKQLCTGSICEKYKLEVCTCAVKDGQDEAAELCHVCCMEKSKYKATNCSWINQSSSNYVLNDSG